MFLKNLPPTKFFFLYLLGHNVDYISLKMIVQKITQFVRSQKMKNNYQAKILPGKKSSRIPHNHQEQEQEF